MTEPTRDRWITTVGGGLVAAAGLLVLTAFATDGRATLLTASTVVLAVGTCVLALGRGSIAGPSVLARAALVLLGAGPLLYVLLPLDRVPDLGAPIGMVLLWLVTAAIVVAAVSVARARVLRGFARWVLVLVAADALLAAVMSTVQLGSLPFVYLDLRLELIRPLALLAFGLAVALDGWIPAIRRRLRIVDEAWRRSTDVGGAVVEHEPEATAQR